MATHPTPTPPAARTPQAGSRPTPSDIAATARARTPVEVTGAQSLVLSLEALEVDTVFGLPGGAILPAYDPLMDSVRVRHILVRHEQGAGHAAEGYAVETGRVGVCMATSGPGATNLITGVVTSRAWFDKLPADQQKILTEETFAAGKWASEATIASLADY